MSISDYNDTQELLNKYDITIKDNLLDPNNGLYKTNIWIKKEYDIVHCLDNTTKDTIICPIDEVPKIEVTSRSVQSVMDTIFIGIAFFAITTILVFVGCVFLIAIMYAVDRFFS